MKHCHYCGEELFSADQIDSGYCGLVCLERSEDDLVVEFDTEDEDNESDASDMVEYDTLEEAAEEGRDYGFDYAWELER